jgi:hypothetical protein
MTLSDRPADAAFRGANEKIAFVSTRDSPFNNEIYVMNPDGSDQVHLAERRSRFAAVVVTRRRLDRLRVPGYRPIAVVQSFVCRLGSGRCVISLVEVPFRLSSSKLGKVPVLDLE